LRFLGPCVGWFSLRQGITCRRILSDKRPLLTLWRLAKSLSRLGSQAHPHQALTRRRTNGSERFSKTILGGMGLRDRLPKTSDERNRWLTPLFWGSIRQQGANMALGGLTPQQMPPAAADRCNDLVRKAHLGYAADRARTTLDDAARPARNFLDDE